VPCLHSPAKLGNLFKYVIYSNASCWATAEQPVTLHSGQPLPLVGWYMDGVLYIGWGPRPWAKVSPNSRKTKTRNKWPKKLQLRVATGAYINNETFSHTCRNFPGKMSHYAEQVAALNTFPTCYSTFPSARTQDLFFLQNFLVGNITGSRTFHIYVITTGGMQGGKEGEYKGNI